MLWWPGAQNTGLFNRKVIRARVHRMITMHAPARQTDGRTTNIMTIARRRALKIDRKI